MRAKQRVAKGQFLIDYSSFSKKRRSLNFSKLVLKMALRTVLRRAVSNLLRPAVGSASALEKTTPTFRSSVEIPCSFVLRRNLHEHTQALDPVISRRFLNLDIGDKVLATYIWIDGTGQVRRRERKEERERGRKREREKRESVRK